MRNHVNVHGKYSFTAVEPAGPGKGATATRQHTEQNFRLPQHRVVRAKTDVGGERELTTATQRRADDGRDYRLGDLRDRGESGLHLT